MARCYVERVTTKYWLICLVAAMSVPAMSASVLACGGGDKPKPAVPAAPPLPPASTGPSASLLSPDSAALATKAPDTFSIVLNTSKGEIEIEVKRSLAPRGADRLYYLASNGYFNGSRFFRVVYGFVAQFGLSGIPMIDREWDTRTLMDDPPKISNTRGTVVFAKNKPNGRATQLFINLKDNSAALDKQKFTPVGRVVRGMDVAAQLLSTYGDLPNQKGLIMSQGNKYLRQRYPELDTIASVTVKK